MTNLVSEDSWFHPSNWLSLRRTPRRKTLTVSASVADLAFRITMARMNGQAELLHQRENHAEPLPSLLRSILQDMAQVQHDEPRQEILLHKMLYERAKP